LGGDAEGARYPVAGQLPAAETDSNPARPLLLSMREGVLRSSASGGACQLSPLSL